jgi:hypothetical protein
MLSGCIAGYYSYKTANEIKTLTTEDIAEIKISYAGNSNSDLASSIERTLRERFRVININKIEDKDFRKDPERIALRGTLKHEDPSRASKIWFFTSFFSLAVIPAVINENATVTFEVIAPNGDEKTFRYEYTERFYSWLPFLFFSPDFFFVFMNGIDDPKKLNETFDQITSQFIVDANQFIVSHARPSSSLPSSNQ